MTPFPESTTNGATLPASRVAFRVDARAEIGIGHFMRCLTLADAVAALGARVRFVCRGLPPHLVEALRDRNFECAALLSGRGAPDAEPAHAAWLGTSASEDADATREALGGERWDLLVVDHYGIDARWERRVRPAATRLFVIDDLADREHDCDALLDQNFYADMDARYRGKVPPECQLLLGPRFALLRPEFAALRERTPLRDGGVRRLLVAFGGADAANLTSAALDAVASEAPHLEVDVVVGAGHPSLKRIRATCADRGYALHVQSRYLADLMSAADLAIGAGGATLWERCCLGLPALARRVAENQQRQLDDAAATGLVYAPREQPDVRRDLALHLRALLENPALLKHISATGRAAVDGRGTRRVVRALGVNPVVVRPARRSDSEMIHRWRNAPAVRSVSRSDAAIDRAAHEAWFERVLADPSRALLVGEVDGRPVGVVRFDVTGDGAEVSIFLADEPVSSGTGSDLLAAAEAWLVRSHGANIRTLRAEVLDGNVPSHRLFQRAAYIPSSTHYTKPLHRDD